MNTQNQIILSIYPNSRGFGYVCIESTNKILDLGIVTVRQRANDRVLSRIKKFVDFFHPTIILVKDYGDMSRGRAKRRYELTEKMVVFANERKLPLVQYTRKQIRDVFEQFGVTTKYEIAQKLITWYPLLAARTPKIRKPWMDEDYHMGIFDAFSLAVTYYYLEK